MLSLSEKQRQGALDINDTNHKISLQEVWTSLPLERRQKVERGLYWIIVGPAVTRLFVKNAPSEVGIRTIRELQSIFQQSESELA